MSESVKNILLVGSDSNWAIERQYVKYLSDHCNVSFFNARGDFLNYYYKNYFNRIIFKLGLSSIISRINKGLIKKVESEKLDAVLVFKGMEIYPETLRIIKSHGIKLFNYNPDHPFDFFGSGSGNSFVESSIKIYDHHFSYSLKIVEELIVRYKVDASWLPFGFNKLVEPLFEDEEINAIAFIGNADKERARIIKELSSSKVSVHVYGNNWNRFLDQDDFITINNAVFEENFVKIAQKYRAHINLFRPHNADSHNMRTFEMPALGCILISPKSEEQLAFFKEERQMFFYENIKELTSICQVLLGLNYKDAFEIKMEAYKISLNNNYSYGYRAKQLFNKIIEIVNK